jgi:hypothetical protein
MRREGKMVLITAYFNWRRFEPDFLGLLDKSHL